jgi:MoaA/NifB/PqqE/SkfB family radical SAM enzyme
VNLEKIGFYTLTDERVKSCSEKSDLMRCELILTARCNFNCPYCRGVEDPAFDEMTYEEAKSVIDYWGENKVHNIRLSGGEPTLWPHLSMLVRYAKMSYSTIERIALSTNGSADMDVYRNLINNGVNDISISLDSCCASTGNKMAGRENVWDKIVSNIRELSKLTYVTVGVVLTEDNMDEINNIVKFASKLGVSDIRLIPAAQNGKKLPDVSQESMTIAFMKHPILKYRLLGIAFDETVRGLSETDTEKCPLVLDDMAVVGDKHYPCIIYMREKGSPIGVLNENTRIDRLKWFESHDCKKDKICSENCLDVCREYNNRYFELRSQDDK